MLTKLASASACLTAAPRTRRLRSQGGQAGPAPRTIPRSRWSGPWRSGLAAATTSCRGTIVDILEKEKLYPENITVENIDGGSGAKGWGQVYGEAGNRYSISSTSGSFLTTPLEADTGWAPEDFTHVGLLATDASLFLTHKKSGQDTWEKWVKYAKAKKKVPVGGIGVVNVDLILHQELAKQAGYEIEYVPFDDEGELITALSSGALAAVTSNPAEVLGQVESGDMNPLLFTGEQADAWPPRGSDGRVQGLSPTW